MLKKLRKKDAKGFTLIELMIVIAIIGILAAIAIPNFIAYRDKAFCSSVEQDAGNILAALSCYFSEPDNLTCLVLASLTGDPTCGFDLNNDSAFLMQTGTGNAAWWWVSVTDASSRCPRGSTYNTYMGSDGATGDWT